MTKSKVGREAFVGAWIANGGDPNEAEAAHKGHLEHEAAVARAEAREKKLRTKEERAEGKERALRAKYSPEPKEEQADEVARRAFHSATMRGV